MVYCCKGKLCVFVKLCFYLPALTLAVFDERKLNKLMSHEGSPHQLHMKQKTIMFNWKCPVTLIIWFLLKLIVCTSMVTVCVSRGTHSMASWAQQPPHLLTDTQDGANRWCVSSGNSCQTSTRVSRGSQPLREYTSNHRRTDGETKTNGMF